MENRIKTTDISRLNFLYFLKRVGHVTFINCISVKFTTFPHVISFIFALKKEL